MQYGKLENGEVIYYLKPENILCEDPTLRGYKEVITVVGESGGISETETQIILTIPQPEPILPTLEEMQEKLKADLLIMVKEIGSMLLSAKEIVGETATYLYLKDQCNQMREQTLQAINTLSYEQLSQFAIREEDAKPLKDAINALILS